MLTGLVPMLICADVQKSIKFYEAAVGMDVAQRMDDVGKSGWAMMQKDGVKLMLASPHYFPDMPKVQERFFQAQYYFYTDDIDELHARVAKAGFEPTGIIQQEYGMREFEMPDLDGHLLIFGQDVKE